MYTIDKIKSYLESQDSIKSAIKNLKELDNTESCKIINDEDKILIYFDNQLVKTRNDVKNLVLDYMDDNGWERNGYEEVMSLDEVLNYLNLKIVK
ncbi:MAG: hypothetical protein SLAVMIC_00087 [uncultured marine phage]|uniref:Uncharacterized protein n=1 Tax=uncultured marine phage TaxID=707152 RepID=A0A8D9FQS4_9VIRU|nr:MAG: hypothetical protein SLAVMIC_00087 [uncultured marine phage]